MATQTKKAKTKKAKKAEPKGRRRTQKEKEERATRRRGVQQGHDATELRSRTKRKNPALPDPPELPEPPNPETATDEELEAELNAETRQYQLARINRNKKCTKFSGKLGLTRWGGDKTEKEQEDQLTSVAREMTGDVLISLFDVATDIYSAPGARTRAANSILDRGYGKAKQKVEMEAGEGLRGLSHDAMRSKLLDSMKDFAHERGLPFTIEPSSNGKPQIKKAVKKKAKGKRK